jgi:hypothetical protein
MYFLAVGFACLFVVIAGVYTFYDSPGAGSDLQAVPIETVWPGYEGAASGYNRNVAMILNVAAAGLFTTAVLGLGARFNPLRAGLMLGGLLLFVLGFRFWLESTGRWAGFVTSALVLVALTAAYPWLEEGLPAKAGRPRAAGPAQPPGQPAPPGTPLEPPPEEESPPPGGPYI